MAESEQKTIKVEPVKQPLKGILQKRKHPDQSVQKPKVTLQDPKEDPKDPKEVPKDPKAIQKDPKVNLQKSKGIPQKLKSVQQKPQQAAAAQKPVEHEFQKPIGPAPHRAKDRQQKPKATNKEEPQKTKVKKLIKKIDKPQTEAESAARIQVDTRKKLSEKCTTIAKTNKERLEKYKVARQNHFKVSKEKLLLRSKATNALKPIKMLGDITKKRDAGIKAIQQQITQLMHVKMQKSDDFFKSFSELQKQVDVLSATEFNDLVLFQKKKEKMALIESAHQEKSQLKQMKMDKKKKSPNKFHLSHLDTNHMKSVAKELEMKFAKNLGSGCEQVESNIKYLKDHMQVESQSNAQITN